MECLSFCSAVLESWLDHSGELEPPDPLSRLPQLKQRIRWLLHDLCTVRRLSFWRWYVWLLTRRTQRARGASVLSGQRPPLEAQGNTRAFINWRWICYISQRCQNICEAPSGDPLRVWLVISGSWWATFLRRCVCTPLLKLKVTKRHFSAAIKSEDYGSPHSINCWSESFLKLRTFCSEW